VGANHTASGLTTGHVLQALSATTFGFAAIPSHTHPTYAYWSRTGTVLSPATAGDYVQATRFEVGSATEFISAGDGNDLALYAADDVRIYAGSAETWRFANNGRLYPIAEYDLGYTSNRLATIYGNTLNVDGATHTIRGVALTFPAANAAGALINNGSGTLSWGAPTPAAHTHSLAYTSTATGAQSATHNHTLAYTATATGNQSVTHNHALAYTSTNTGTNSAFNDRQVKPIDWGDSYYVYVSNSSGGTSPYWTRMAMYDGTHYHTYDKTNTPTGNASADHTHDYDKANTPTGNASAGHTHTYDKANTPTGGIS
jgi:hypothetical protein